LGNAVPMVTAAVTRRTEFAGDPYDEWAKARQADIQQFTAPLVVTQQARNAPNPRTDRGNLGYLHGYKNYGTPNCGQAAIATTWGYWGRNYDYCGPKTVQDSNDGGFYWNDLYAVNSGIPSHYPSDVPGGGMSPNRICDGLRDAQMWNSWAWGPQQTLDNVQGWLNNSPCIPVICLINAGYFENWWSVGPHWVVVYAIGDGKVYFANPAVTGIDPNDPGALNNEPWRAAVCSTQDFDHAWGANWTLTKCYVVGHA